MKTIRCILALAAAFLLLAGCVSLKTPVGYAETSHTGGYAYKAISTDASVITVAEYENEDEDMGSLDYWTQAARKQMTLSRGYIFEEEGDFSCPQGSGHWMRFARKYRGTDYLYLLGIVVDGSTIYALEAGGEKAVFEKDLPFMLKAFATLN
ncbi:MAG: hypothetical protein JRJ87_23430 [Deltaproteobacteria bacterium]|nr:hypothetical protein [Deltaproteobacteria bacterium]